MTIDRKTDKAIYNPEFYAMKHFSATIMPGAKRIAVSGGPFKKAVAFLTPSGSKVIIFANETDLPVYADLVTDRAPLKVEAPAKSMNTVMIP